MSLLTCTVGTFADFFFAGVGTTMVVGAAICFMVIRK
jgi:hypothetical protein